MCLGIALFILFVYKTMFLFHLKILKIQSLILVFLELEKCKRLPNLKTFTNEKFTYIGISNRLGSNRVPAMQAVIKQARLPAIYARITTFEKSAFL